MKFTFSVFTPCYNSEKIIKRLFDSLQSQTYQSFEWIVIDDVSSDSTIKVIEELIPNAKFSVKFIKNKTNQMVCKNREIAIAAAEGEFFIKLSHDDMLVPQALENFMNAWQYFPEEYKVENKIAGVILNCVSKEGVLEGTPFPKDYWVADDFVMRFKEKVKGEKSSATLTKVLRQYPFYYQDVDVYVPEDQNFWTISNSYQYIYSNKPGRIHVVNDGMHTHLEKQIGRGQKYLKGFAFHYQNMINKFGSKIWGYSKIDYMLFLTNYVRYARYNKTSYAEIWRGIFIKKWLIVPAVLLGNINELFKYKTIL